MGAGNGLAAVERRFLEGRFDEALAELDAVAAGGVPPNGWHGWRRRVLANLGRLEAAADAGMAAIAEGGDQAEGCFRLAEILVRLGRPEAALDMALRAAAEAPADPRPLTVALEAALAQPALLPKLSHGLGPQDDAAPWDRAPDLAAPRLLLPGGRRFLARTDADHPDARSTLMSAAGIGFATAEPGAATPAAAFAAGIDQCRRVVDALTTADPGIDRASAARYVGHRALSLLDGAGGAVADLLTVTPMTVGQRPYILLFDLIASLFQPFLPFNNMLVDGARSSWYRLLRAWLESPYCVGIYSPYAGAAALLGAFFDSRCIESKTAMVDHLAPDTDRLRSSGVAVSRPARGDRPPTLLFSASAVDAASKFMLRGGVYAIATFRALAERFPDLRLVIRSPLPPSLDPELATFVLSHPRITVIERPLDDAEYLGLFASADLFLSPSAALYMNSTLNAMRFGAVPVVSDVFGADELIRHGRNGVLVPLGAATRIDVARGVLEQDFRAFQGVDGPGDRRFFQDYCDAVAGLLANRDRLDSLSFRAIRDVADGFPYRPRGEPMAAILGRGLETAVGVWKSRPPLFRRYADGHHPVWRER